MESEVGIHFSPFHPKEAAMKKAIVGLVLLAAALSVFVGNAESAKRMVLAEFFGNTS